MKTTILILGLLALALAVALFFRNQEASQERHAALTETQRYSNLWHEATLKVTTLESFSAVLQETISNRLAELVVISNRYAIAQAGLERAEAANRAAQTDLQTTTARIAGVEAQLTDLNSRLDLIPALEKEVMDFKKRVVIAAAERDALQQEIGFLKVDNDNLLRNLKDPVYLFVALASAREETELARRMTGRRAHQRPNLRARVELQPDHSVKLVLPATNILANQIP